MQVVWANQENKVVFLNLTRKAILGGTFVSGVIATSLGSYHFYGTPATIGQALEKEGLKLLNNDEKWKELAKKYISLENGDDEVSKRIDGLSLGKIDKYNDPRIAEELKEKCKSLWNAELSKTDKDKKEKEIRDWCISDAKNLKN